MPHHPVHCVIHNRARAAYGIITSALLISLAACGSASSTQAHPAATSTPAPLSPTATPAGPVVLYQNALAAPPSGNWVNDPSSGCFFDSGSFHLKDKGFCIIPPEDIGNTDSDASSTVVIVADAKQISGPATLLYGIGWYYGAPFLYRFEVESDGKWAFQKCPGACTTAAGPTSHSAIHTGLGATNTLEVHVKGSHFDFFVNGTQVGQADDTTHVGGPLAFVSSNGIEVAFSNLKITRLP